MHVGNRLTSYDFAIFETKRSRTSFFVRAAAIAMLLVLATASLAFADAISADTDALATATPHANGLNATQDVGTTVDYDYSALVSETGNANDDVFQNSGDTVTATVSIDDNPAGWTLSLDDTSFSWTAYDTNQAGKLSVTVPAGATDGAANAIKVKILVTNISNGETMSDQAKVVVLNYTIEANVPAGPTNAKPVITSAAFTADHVDCRNQATLSVTFTDTGSTSWTYSVDWDNDGTFEDVDVATGLSSPGTFAATHTYDTPGTYTAVVVVKDNQGLASDPANDSIVVNQTYTVAFLAPFDTSNPNLAVINKAKAGRVVPVKATIFDDCAQTFVTDPATLVRIGVSKATTPTGSSSDSVEAYSDAGASNGNTAYFRWSSDGFWIYNLDTKALALVTGQSYRIDIFLGAVKATDDEWGLLATVK